MTSLAPFNFRSLILVLAPTNLGLRPTDDGKEPGVWRAPDALMAAHLQNQLGVGEVVAIARPAYEFQAQPGTCIRNGLTIRKFSLELSAKVHAALEGGRLPIVIGGDCSALLGCLYGARLAGGRGLVHIDGHSDFFHPGNYSTRERLGSAAGMDLALATGRGELLLSQWPNIECPLVRDEDAVQLGERDALREDFNRFYGDIARTKVKRIIAQDALAIGVDSAAALILKHLDARALERVWLHVDLDVLDQNVMPAVDSPGSPGLNFTQLGSLMKRLLQSNRFIGADVTIYDPERDPEAVHAAPIVAMLARAINSSL